MSSRMRTSGTTIREVAQRAKVSAMTVSRVINGSLAVHPDTRARILSAIEALNYAPKQSKRQRLEPVHHTIGLVLPNLRDQFFSKTALSVEVAASAHGYRVLICNSHDDITIEHHNLNDLILRHVDGVIIAPIQDASSKSIREFMHHQCPIVLIDREAPGVVADIIHSENTQGAMEITQHLINLGHRRIAFVSGDYRISSARDRLYGYRLALDTAGILFDSTLIYEEIPSQQQSGYHAAMHLLQQPNRPQAIVVVNSGTLIGVVQACSELRLRIPHDIAIASFDDFDYVSTLFPFFTVVEQSIDLMGATAVDRLLVRMREPHVDPVNIQIPTTLITRRSCGEPHMASFFAEQFALR